ncbi:MAG: GDSL-type esterase/lipase family protein [Planctomycetaceae bacterium]
MRNSIFILSIFTIGLMQALFAQNGPTESSTEAGAQKQSAPKPGDYNNLGHPSTTPVDRPKRPGWLDRHQQYCARAKEGEVDLVFLGDSLTQRWETAPNAWKKHFADRHAVQMGIDNDGTQQILWRIDHGTLDGIQPKLIVLLIGINNIGNDDASPEEVRDGVKAILERLQKRLPESPVLLMGLLPYGYPGTNYAERIQQTNILIEELADGKRFDISTSVRNCSSMARSAKRSSPMALTFRSEATKSTQPTSNPSSMNSYRRSDLSAIDIFEHGVRVNTRACIAKVLGNVSCLKVHYGLRRVKIIV